MAKKKSSKSKKKSSKKKAAKKKQPAKPAPEKKAEPPAKPGKIVINKEMKTLWLRLRSRWYMNFTAFYNALSALSEKQANELYDIVKHSLFKGSYAEIIHEHPEMKELLKNDEDRLCMHDIYERLSWRLRRREPLPESLGLKEKMKSRVGRAWG